jgi:hypothetical protein
MLSVCALSSDGHAQDIPGGKDIRLLPVAVESADCADVHAVSAIARATATPETPPIRPGRPGRRRPRPLYGHGLIIAFPIAPMLVSIDASPPAGNDGRSREISVI